MLNAKRNILRSSEKDEYNGFDAIYAEKNHPKVNPMSRETPGLYHYLHNQQILQNQLLTQNGLMNQPPSLMQYQNRYPLNQAAPPGPFFSESGDYKYFSRGTTFLNTPVDESGGYKKSYAQTDNMVMDF